MAQEAGRRVSGHQARPAAIGAMVRRVRNQIRAGGCRNDPVTAPGSIEEVRDGQAFRLEAAGPG